MPFHAKCFHWHEMTKPIFIMQIVSIADDLHEMLKNKFSGKNRKNIINLSSAELAQSVVKVKWHIIPKKREKLKVLCSDNKYILHIWVTITKTCLFEYIENFTSKN